MKVNSISLIALFLLIGLSTPTLAQDNHEAFVQQIENRATSVINETMAAVGERVEDFNQRMSAVYALMPLEAKNFDSATIVSNIAAIEGFLSYIDTYRKQAKSLSQVLTDSITSLRKELPATQRRNFLISFEKAYNKDAAAFDAYLASLSKLFRRVSGALEFVRYAHYTVEGTTVQFEHEKDHKRFSDFMEGVQAATVEANKAAGNSKQATAEANQVMQDVYGKK